MATFETILKHLKGHAGVPQRGSGEAPGRLCHMWTPPFGKGWLSDSAIGSVQSYVRPVGAALRPLGPDEVRGSGPITGTSSSL